MTDSGELVMNLRHTWNSKRLPEIDEAKREFYKYLRKGYEMVSAAGKILEKFQPYAEEFIVKTKKINRCCIKILTENGDDRVIWDKDNGPEAIEAKKKFKELLGQGMKAYSVNPDGSKGRRIEEFDVDAEEILMVGKTCPG